MLAPYLTTFGKAYEFDNFYHRVPDTLFFDLPKSSELKEILQRGPGQA